MHDAHYPQKFSRTVGPSYIVTVRARSDSDAALLKSHRSARRTYVRIDRPISRRAVRTPKFSRRDKAAYTNKQLAVRRKKRFQDSETQDRHPH